MRVSVNQLRRIIKEVSGGSYEELPREPGDPIGACSFKSGMEDGRPVMYAYEVEGRPDMVDVEIEVAGGVYTVRAGKHQVNIEPEMRSYRYTPHRD
jgi:hypothetical protein